MIKILSAILIASLVFQLTGCYGTEYIKIEDLPKYNSHDKITLTTKDKKKYRLDSFLKWELGENGIELFKIKTPDKFNKPQEKLLMVEQEEISYEEISLIGVEEYSRGRTVVLALGLAGAAVLAAYMLAASAIENVANPIE